MKDYQSLNHTKSDCKYHVVFMPKRRTPVNSSILERAIDKIRRIGNNINHINLIAHASNLNLAPDSEHLQQVLNEHTKVLRLIGKY
jgi:REP element-mobilizing transposase RayT